MLMKLSKGATECPGSFLAFIWATCATCGQPRYGIRHCNTFLEPCGTCQIITVRADPEPPPQPKAGKRKHIIPTPSLKIHAVGLHFIESITAVEECPASDHNDSVPPEREDRPLTGSGASIRGWVDKAQQSRATALLAMTDEQMTTTLQRDKDIILVPGDGGQRIP
jgi:hypothetical protein